MTGERSARLAATVAMPEGFNSLTIRTTPLVFDPAGSLLLGGSARRSRGAASLAAKYSDHVPTGETHHLTLLMVTEPPELSSQ